MKEEWKIFLLGVLVGSLLRQIVVWIQLGMPGV